MSLSSTKEKTYSNTHLHLHHADSSITDKLLNLQNAVPASPQALFPENQNSLTPQLCLIAMSTNLQSNITKKDLIHNCIIMRTHLTSKTVILNNINKRNISLKNIFTIENHK